MTIVVPISHHDADRADKWLECVLKFSPIPSHDILFVVGPSVEAKAYELAGKLSAKSFCNKVDVHKLYKDPEHGWPMASNFHWYEAMQLMETKGSPWFWMELDCLPVRDGWADAIAAAYTSAGARLMGCVVKTPWKDEVTGQEVPSRDGPNDKMMCGCGVYPPALRARMDALGSDEYRKGKDGMLDSLAQGGASVEIPWDLFLRHPFMKIGMAHTDVIGDYWNTLNYRIEEGALLCDPNPFGHDGKPAAVRRHGIINPANVVIHGCKDDSLYHLVMEGLDTRSLVQIAKPIEKVAEAVHVNPEIAAMKSEMAELKELLKAALAPKPELPKTVDTKLSGIEASPKEPVIVKPAASTMADKAYDIICSSDKRMRIDQLATKMEVPANKLKKAIESDSRIEIGKLGWLSVTGERVAS